MENRRLAGIVAFATGCVLSVGLAADTLVFRDGRRIEGRLVSVRDESVDFEQPGGWFGRPQRIQVDLRDIRRIEFDDDRVAPDRADGGDDHGGRGERPRGLRERPVSVAGTRAWTDTGVDVRRGQIVYFSASGRVRWGPGSQDGPQGAERSPRNAGSPMPDRPAGALIGRIGPSSDYFFIGTETGGLRMRDAGRLFLGVNDDQLGDNGGSFRVTIAY